MHSTEYPSFSVFTLSQAVKFGLKFETLKPNLTAWLKVKTENKGF